MNQLVLDSWPILAFLHKEENHDKVDEILTRATKGKLHLLISVMNLAEVYYTLIRERGKEQALVTINALKKIPIETVSLSDELVLRMAEVKASYAIPVGDCFAVATALERHTPILTGDHEFKKVEKLVKIMWL